MVSRPKSLLGSVAILTALALPAAALGAAGDLDPSFDGDGKVTTAFGTTPFHPSDSGNGAARLATGEVYVAGTSEDDFALVRFTSAGVLDTSFGGGDGIVITDLTGSGSEEEGNAVSVNSATGDVVVAGRIRNVPGSGNDFAVARYTSAGVLDTTFGGGDGIVTTDFPGGGLDDNALAVTHLPGGDLAVAGETDTDPNPNDETEKKDFAIAVYTSAGVLDTNFDGNGGSGNGTVTTAFGAGEDVASAVLATSGSTILVAGTTDPSGADPGDFALARYDAVTGVLDVGFDTDGKQTVDFNGSTDNGDQGLALATDSTGKIVVAGSAGVQGNNTNMAVARLTTTGGLDGGFDSDGKAQVDFPSTSSGDAARGVAVQGDDKVVLAGQTGGQIGNEVFMVARLGTGGTPDAGFGGGDGIVTTDFNPSAGDEAAAVLVDATTIVAAGTGNDNFAAARYTIADGTLDGTFGIGGQAEADVPHPTQSSETGKGVAVQPDGKIVVAGPTDVGAITQVGGDQQFGLARYNANGSLDAGFGAGGVDGDGLVSTNFGFNLDGSGTADSAAAVALQSDGKIVVVGSTGPPGAATQDFAIARYTTTGALDPAFGGGDGKVTTDFGGAVGDSATAVAIEGTPGDPDFRIVAAGTKGLSSFASDFAVAAYNEDGSPDNGFGGTGSVTTSFGALGGAHGVAIQADGSIVVAGERTDFINSDIAIARYEADGDPDPSFDTDGKVLTDFGGNGDVARAVAVRELGAGEVRIVVAGQGNPGTGIDGALAVYNTFGSLDAGFDVDGLLSIPLNSNFNSLQGVAFQQDGKIVASGTVEAPGFGLVRVDSAGSLDPTFGGDGLVSTDFGADPGQYAANGLAIQSDGRIVAAGGRLTEQQGSDFLVARYLADPAPTPPATTPPVQQPVPKKKKCKKKKHRAAASKKCKKKK